MPLRPVAHLLALVGAQVSANDVDHADRRGGGALERVEELKELHLPLPTDADCALCRPGVPRTRKCGKGDGVARPIMQGFRIEVGTVRPHERVHLRIDPH